MHVDTHIHMYQVHASCICVFVCHICACVHMCMFSSVYVYICFSTFTCISGLAHMFLYINVRDTCVQPVSLLCYNVFR